LQGAAKQVRCAKLLEYLSTDRDAPCPFILLSSGRSSAPRRSCAILRQTAIGQKPGQAEREQVRRGFGAVDMPGLCRPQVQLMSPSRSRAERRSCRGCAGRLQFGRRKEPRRAVPIGRDNVRYSSTDLRRMRQARNQPLFDPDHLARSHFNQDCVS